MDGRPRLGESSPATLCSVPWDVECLMAGDNQTHVIDAHRGEQPLERTFKKGVLYAASRSRASAIDFHAVEGRSVSPFVEAVGDSGILRYGVSHFCSEPPETRDVGFVRVDRARLDVRAPSRVEINLAAIRRSRHRSKGEVVRDGIIAWVRKNPGYALSFGGPGARLSGRKQSNKDLSYLYREERSLLLDPMCPLRGPGRCLPASIGVACLVFLREKGGPELTRASIEKVLAYFSSNFIFGTSFSQIAFLVSDLFNIVKEDPALSEVLRGVRLVLRRVSTSSQKAFVQHCVCVTEDSNGSVSISQDLIGYDSTGDSVVFVIRCATKHADHTFVVDLSGETIYDCVEQLPMKLCLASLGICAGIGPEVNGDKFFRSIKEIRRVMAHREATSSKDRVCCSLPY